MFVDCTGLSIQFDPTRYPTGLVIQLLSIQPPGRERVGSITGEPGQEIPPKIQEEWLIAGSARGRRLIYSMTEHPELTVFGDEGGDGTNMEMFEIRCYYLDHDNNLVIRDFELSVVRRPESWTIELDDQSGEGSRNYTLWMRDFDPRAVIQLYDQPEEPVAKDEEKPAGRPLWERLGEDD